MIECEGYWVVVRTPTRGELVIFWRGYQDWVSLFSAARTRYYIQHVCMGYLAYVVDTRDRKQVLVLNVSGVRDFADVFPKELPGVHPERQVEFRIDLVSSKAPITKAS